MSAIFVTEYRLCGLEESRWTITERKNPTSQRLSKKKYNADLLTMRDFAYLIFVMVFICVRLQPAFNTRSKSFFQGWTGPDSGGSCSFQRGNMCNWTNSNKDQFDWIFKDSSSSNIFLNNFFKNENDRAWLVGPAMCERKEADLCLTIMYKSDKRMGAEISLYVCKNGSSEDVCSKMPRPEWSTRDWDENTWKVENISFKSPGRFQMLIEGKKHKDSPFSIEANVFIHYVKYKNTSCDDQHKVTITTQTALQSTSEETTIEEIMIEETTIEETKCISSEGTTVCPEIDTLQPTETTKHEEKGEEEEKSSHSIIVPVVISTSVVFLVVALTGITVVVVFRRRRSTAKDARKASDAVYRRNDSLVMVTNQLYGVTVGHSFLSPEDSAGFLSEMQPLPQGTQTPSPTTDNDSVFYRAVDKGKKAQGSSTAQLQTDLLTKGAAKNPAAAENDYENTGVKPAEVVYYNVAGEIQDHQQNAYDHLNDLNIKVKPS